MRVIAIVLALTAFCVRAAPFAYIPAFLGNTVTIIDTATQSIVAAPAVGNGPAGVAISADGTRVFVPNKGSDDVTVMTATGTVLATIPVGAGPEAAAFDRASNRVYVTNGTDNTVSAIDAATLTVIATIPVGNFPRGIVVNPASTTSRVYVANFNDGTISVIDSSLAVSTTITLAGGSTPLGLALNPSGSLLLAADTNANTVDRFVTATNTPAGSYFMAVSSGPTAVVIDHSGTHAYVTNSSSNLVVGFDLTTNTQSFSRGFGVGATTPWGIDIDASDGLLYVVLAGADGVQAVQTASPFGTVKVYGTGPDPAPLEPFIGPGPPSAPVAVSAVAGNAQVTVSFSPPASDGGTAVTSYTATCGAQSASSAGAPIVVTGVANGAPVTCAVVASNAMGAGPSAAAGPVTPAAASIDPRDVPALSRWGLAIMALALAACVILPGRRR